MIHIIDEVSFSEITCDLNKFRWYLRKKDFFSNTFELGLLFLNTLNNNQIYKKKWFCFWTMSSIYHYWQEAEVLHFVVCHILSKSINCEDIDERSYEQFYSRYMMIIKRKKNSMHFPDERKMMLLLRLEYWSKKFKFFSRK
jgi:hypothetical protein